MEIATKLVEQGYDKGFLGWFELSKFYQLIHAMELLIGDSEKQLDLDVT